MSKYGKMLDKVFNPDIAKAYREVEFDGHLINQIIGQHFYRLGLFELGDCFVNESQEPYAAALKAPLYEMYQNLEHLRTRNLEPALNWARKNRQTLEAKVSSKILSVFAVTDIDMFVHCRPSHSCTVLYGVIDRKLKASSPLVCGLFLLC